MAGADTAIKTKDLSKRYGGSGGLALEKLDIEIKKGEVYGFLGPNGAGKSTTIRLLMNFIQPSSGSAWIAGRNVVTESVVIKDQVGYLAGDVALYPKMTGRQFLDYMGRLQQGRRQSYQKALIKLFKPNLNQKIATLSKGNKQKLGVIQAFMHEPQVLILDEPTSGLDPLMQEAFFELVEATKQKGATIFLSSHNLSEVQKICDRVGFIRDGKLVGEQRIAEIGKSSTQVFEIVFSETVPLAELRRIRHASLSRATPRSIVVKIKGDLRPLFAVLAQHKVHSLDRKEDNLEQDFLRFYQGGGK